MLISLKAAPRRCFAKYMFFKILQNSQEKTCAGVTFLIKLQAAKIHKIHKKTSVPESRFIRLETLYQHQIDDTLQIFHSTAYSRIRAFGIIYPVCSYSKLESPEIVSILSISYLMWEVVVMFYKKKKKKLNKQGKDPHSSCQVELQQGLFCIKNFPSWNNTYFTYYLIYIIANKNSVIFLTLKDVRYPPLDLFHYFRKLVLIACISKKICYFSLVICHIREARERCQ